MKRKPRGIEIEVNGEPEMFLLSTFVTRSFANSVGSKSPDEAAKAFSANPLETMIKMAEISYNEYPGNEKLDEREICYLLDEMELEDIDVPYVRVNVPEADGGGFDYEPGQSTISKWEYLQHEIVKACFPRPRRIKNPNGKVTA